MAAEALGDRDRFADLVERHTGARIPERPTGTVAVIIDLAPVEQGGTAT